MANRTAADIEKDIQLLGEQMAELRAHKLEYARELDELNINESVIAKIARLNKSERVAMLQQLQAQEAQDEEDAKQAAKDEEAARQAEASGTLETITADQVTRITPQQIKAT